MKHNFFAVLAVLLLSTSVSAEFDPEKIANSLRYYEENPSDVPLEHIVGAHAKTKFIFFKGWAGEVIPGYFAAAKSELERLTGTKGIKNLSKRRVFVLNGDSNRNLVDNAIHIQESVKNILAQSEPGTKLIVVGHSKGAVELWTAVMRNHDFALQNFAGAVFLQGPFLGSPLADFIVQERSIGEVEPFLKNPVMYAARASLMKPYRSKKLRGGGQAITTEAATTHFRGVNETYGAMPSDLENKVLFVGSVQPERRGLGRIFPPVSAIMDVCVRSLAKLTDGSPNDGMVTLQSQLPPGVEARSQVLQGLNHMSFQATSTGRSLGKALFEITP